MRDDPALRATGHASLVTRHCAAILAAAALAGCATTSPGMEEAKRIVDRSEPLRCDIVALERQLAGAAPDESPRLAAELDQVKLTLKHHYMATMDEYIAVMKRISFEERQEVRRYADAVAGRCPASRKAEGDSRK